MSFSNLDSISATDETLATLSGLFAAAFLRLKARGIAVVSDPIDFTPESPTTCLELPAKTPLTGPTG
jgi:hypothetical protein